MGPVRPGLVPLLLLALLARSSASIIGRGTARQLRGSHACPAASETCPQFGPIPASLGSIVCGPSKSVLLVTVGLVDNPSLKAPSWLSPQRLLAVQVDRNMADGSMAVRVSNRSDDEGAMTSASDTCKRFKVKKVFDFSPSAEAKPLAGLVDLLVSNECDTHGVFSEPGHVLLLSERPLGDVANADVLSLGDGVSVFLLPKSGNVTLPACFDVQRQPGRRPPEKALLVADTEPDAAVPCHIGRQPIGLSCPLCPPHIGDELKARVCTAPTAFIVRRNAERLTAHSRRKPWFLPKLEISQVAPLRTVTEINIRVQERRPLGGNESGSSTCVRGTLSILDDVSPGGIDTIASNVNFIMRSNCACDFLRKDAGYAMLLHDKPIPRSARTVQLDDSFTLVSLPAGVTNLTSCASDAPDQADLMLGDQPVVTAQRQLVAPVLPQGCPVCHSELEADLYNPICGARTVVRMLSLNPAARGPSGTYIGKTRIVQSVRGAQDKIGHTLIYTLPENCKCDYVTKPSRQYFVFMDQIATAGGRPTHVPFTNQMHILAYSYRNARLLHDALSACPSSASESLPVMQKRMDTYAAADQAEYVGSYGGASGPLYGAAPGASQQTEPKVSGGYGTYEAGRSAYGSPSYRAAPASPSYGGAAHTAAYGAGSAYGPAPAPGYASPKANAGYAAQPPPPPGYGVTSSPSYGYAQSPWNYNTATASYGASAPLSPQSYNAAPASSYSSSAGAAHVTAPGYGAPQGSTYGSGSATAAPGYNSATTVPAYGGSSGHGPSYGATSYSGGATAAPSYVGAAPAAYVPTAPSYGPPPAPTHNSAPASGYGAQAQPSNYGSASQSSYNSGSAPTDGSSSSYSPGLSYNAAKQEAEQGPSYNSAPAPSYGATAGGSYGSASATSYGTVGATHAPRYAASAPSASYGVTGHGGASASVYNQGSNNQAGAGYGAGAPSHSSGTPSASSYGLAPSLNNGGHPPGSSSYGPSSYNAAQQKAPAYGSPAPGYGSSSSGNYGSGMAANYGPAPSPGFKNPPDYVRAPNPGYGPPAAAYSNEALPASGAYGSGYSPAAAAYGQASSPTYGPPAYSGGTDAAYGAGAYSGYRDVTYVPPYGMVEYPPAAYEPLYPNEDYATVISYVPTYASDDEYSAGTQDSYGNAGYGTNGATYSPPPYAAPGYGGSTYSPPASSAYTVAPSSYRGNIGYDSPYGTYAPPSSGHSEQASKGAHSSPVYSSASYGSAGPSAYNPPPAAPVYAAPGYPAAGGKILSYGGAAPSQSYGSASHAALAVSYSPPSYTAPAYAQHSYGGSAAAPYHALVPQGSAGGSYLSNTNSAGSSGAPYNSASSASSPYFSPKYPQATYAPAASPGSMYPSPMPSATSYAQKPAPTYNAPASSAASYTAAPAAPAYATPQSYGQLAHKPPAGGKPSYINAPVPTATYGPPRHSVPSYSPAAAGQGTAYVTAGYDQAPHGSSSYTATVSAPAYAAPKPYASQTQYGSAPPASSGSSYNPAAYATTAGYSGAGGHDAPSYRSPGKAYEPTQGRNPSYDGQPTPSYATPAYGPDDTQQSSYDGSSSAQAYTTSSYGSVSYTTQGSSPASYSATYAPAAHNAPAYSMPSSNGPTRLEAAAASGPAEYSAATYAPPSYNAPSPSYNAPSPSYNAPSYSASSAPLSYSAPSYVASNAAPSSASQTYNPSYGSAGATMPSYAGLPKAPSATSSGGKPYSVATVTVSPPVYPVASYAPSAYVSPNYVQPSYAATNPPPAYAPPDYFSAAAAPPTYNHPSYAPSYAPPSHSAPVYAPMASYGHVPHRSLYPAPAYLTVTYAPAAYAPGPYGQHSYTPPTYSAPLYPPHVQPTYAAAAYPIPPYAEQPYPPHHGPQYNHPSHNQPHYGGATYAPPAYSAPSYGVSYAPPAYSAPSYALPSYNVPANLVSYAPPAYSASQYPQPAYSKEVYSASYAPPAYAAPSYSKPPHPQPSYGASIAPVIYKAPASAGPTYGQPAHQNTAAHMVAVQHAPSYGGYASVAAGPVKYPVGHHAAPSYGDNAGQNAAYGQPSYPRYPQQAVTMSYTLPAQPLPSYFSPSHGNHAYGAPVSAYGPAKPNYVPAPQQRPAQGATYAPAGPQGVGSYGQPPAYGSEMKAHATSAPHSYSAPASYASATAAGASSGNGAYGAATGSGGGNEGAYGQGPPQSGAYTTMSYTAPTPTYESAYTTYSPSGQSQYTTYATPSSYSPSYTTYAAPSSQPSYTTYSYSPSTYTTRSSIYSQQLYTTYATPTAYSPAPATTHSPSYSGHSESDYGSSSNSGPASYGVTYAPTYAPPAPSYSPPSYHPPDYEESSYGPASYSAPPGYTTVSYSAVTHAPQGYNSPSYSQPAYSGPSYGEASHAPAGYSGPTAGYPPATYAPPGYSAPSHSPPPYSAPPHADPGYPSAAYTGVTDVPAGYSAPPHMPPPNSAGGYGAATYAPAAQSAPAFSPTLSDYRGSAPDYPPPALVQPAYGRSVHPEALMRYAPAKTLEPSYKQAYSMGPLKVAPQALPQAPPEEPPYKPKCPQAAHTCPVCPAVLDKELLKNICNYDLVAEAEVSYPPQAGAPYGGLCSEMCVGEILHGTASVMDKIRFSINKYCSCDTAYKEYGKVIVFSTRHSWHAHGGSYGELILDDKTVLLPASAATVKALRDALKVCNRGHRYPGRQAYADAAYTGPAGCPDPFDESCPQCASTIATESLATDLCTSEYASVVAIGLDYQKMAVHKNGRFSWKQTYLPDIQVNEETAFGTNLSVVIKVNATPTETALAEPEPGSLTDSCLTYTVKALYNVSRGSDPVADTYDLQLFLDKRCPCQQLKSQLPGYALLVVDKQSKLSDGVLQLGSGAKLYPLEYGMHTLPSCPVEGDSKDSRIDPGPETKLPLPELEIPVEGGADTSDEGPCPEDAPATCPVCIDASEEPAATATQYCKSEYAAVVSIPDDAFLASSESAIQPWWAPKLSLSTVSGGSSIQVNVNVRPKARYQFPQTDRTVGHADDNRKCRSGKLHVKQQITSGHQEEPTDAVKFTIMSSCKCGFLEQPTQFAVLASINVPNSDQPLHLSEDVTLISLPLGKTELPKCVRAKPTKKARWKFW
ncbi:LOW QUALITY PROTEIN: mucin-19-like [Dermacentor silvarum]|uniref:LOW QUALITY PROTEIN: mucin-19-like n=1 Tax=Dermacentor silvarum TaxID=543639 RepID=UPI00210139AD|nr:LOW QUALITY PROTEIN: mucin-19-like [Dermacentor silvarum]